MTRFPSRLLLALLAMAALPGCRAEPRPVPLSALESKAIADSLQSMITSAYDLSRQGDRVAQLMSLYPDSGPVISASGGIVTTSRDSVEAGVRAFWENVGKNMREPRWIWDMVHVDVLARDAASVTGTYRVPHLTPAGQPHVIAGAWTAVFARRAGRWVIIQEHLSDLPEHVHSSP